MTRFKIVFKDYKPAKIPLFKRVVLEREWTLAYGDGYFISDNDSSGYSRLVVYKKVNGKNEHTFICNAHDCLYILPQEIPQNDEPEE